MIVRSVRIRDVKQIYEEEEEERGESLDVGKTGSRVPTFRSHALGAHTAAVIVGR